MSRHFDRALFHFRQSRLDDAERELRHGLADDPSDSRLHALLALVLSERNQYEEATAEAQQGIHLSPDDPFAHYARAGVMANRNRLEEAAAAIGEAIRLDPYHSHYFAKLASIQYQRRKWSDALRSAEQGLQIDAEDTGCANLRAAALIKLGRKEEARSAVDATLAKDPQDEVTHTNKGWLLLESGDPKGALEHFREALRNNPLSTAARAGLVEALKARYFVYRIVLQYFLWMSKLSGKAQWAVIIGLYLAYVILRNIARANPEFAPFIWPVLIAYFVFVLLTWLAQPLFNLALRFNKYGRYALDQDDLAASTWVGAALLLALICGVAALITWSGFLGLCAGFFALMMQPLAGVFLCDKGWPRTVMGCYAAGLVLLGAAALGSMRLEWFSWQASLLALVVFLLGVFISSLLANALAQVTPTR